MHITAKSDLSPGRRRLVELMQHVNFGRIEGLLVRRGEPVFEPTPPRVVLEVKFGAENGARRESSIADFQLKHEVVDLFAHLDAMPDAHIETLTVKHGLPFGMHVQTQS